MVLWLRGQGQHRHTAVLGLSDSQKLMCWEGDLADTPGQWQWRFRSDSECAASSSCWSGLQTEGVV
jgi:hypothetical protein